MEKLAGIARSIMGGGDAGQVGDRAPLSDEGADPAMLARLASIIGSRGGIKSEKKALFEAMRPYMSEKRRKKLDKALKIAWLAGIAEAAASEFGLGEDK